MVPAISIVLPLYNEAAHVAELYRRTVESLDTAKLDQKVRDRTQELMLAKQTAEQASRAKLDFELVCIDDGSHDATFAELERIHAADGRIRAVRLKRNFGQHAAMHAGLVRARGEILVTMDGDLQNSPEDIPLLVAAVEGGARGPSISSTGRGTTP